MKLSELYKERMAALPELTRKMLVDTVGSAAVYAIQHDIPRKFRESTLQKLAELWKCSIGDIKAAIAECPQVTECGEIVKAKKKEEAVMDTVDKVAAMLAAEQIAAEQPETVPDEDDAVEYGFAVQEQIEEPMPMTVEEYRQKLKDLFLRIASNVSDPYTDMGNLTASFGKAVLDMLVKEDQDVR